MKLKPEYILYIKIGASVLLAILITFIIMMFYASKTAPKIYFYNGDELITDGEVEVGSETLTINQDGYVQPTNVICKSKQTVVRLLSGQFSTTPEFYFYPYECLRKVVKYSVEEERQEKETIPDKVTFRFYVKENSQNLRGKLYFNNVFKTETLGTIDLTRQECASISKIVISTSPTTNVSWDNIPSYCESKDTIEFPVSSSSLN